MTPRRSALVVVRWLSAASWLLCCPAPLARASTPPALSECFPGFPLSFFFESSRFLCQRQAFGILAVSVVVTEVACEWWNRFSAIRKLSLPVVLSQVWFV